MPRLSALVAAAALVVLGAFAFRVHDPLVLPQTPYNYAAIALPAYLDVPPIRNEDNTPAGNPITDAGATLGRVLFYDTRLSQNATVSCATCHQQEAGFSDPRPLSLGFQGGETGRNSMGLAFARFYENGHFFWDERAATLEAQALLPIQDPTEMGMTLDEVVARLTATDEYPALFAAAFGTAEVTSDRVARALAQFVRSIVAPNSTYDRGRQQQPGPPGQPLAGLTAQENQGLGLFFGRGRCDQCHRGDLFVGDQARNNGLDATLVDAGAGGGRFKTGSLRNVALTAPYMHDGRFATLGDVVDHYSTGIQNSPGLDNRLRDNQGRPIRLNFSPQERAALVAFLNTLTDPTLATDPRWSDPFAQAPATDAQADPAPGLALELAGPNPARTETAFRLRVGEAMPVRLDVFSATGRHVATLLDTTVSGSPTVRWSTQGLAAGVYVVRLQAGGAVATRSVAVVR